MLPVNSADAIEWARKCAMQEGILVGISSAALAAAAQIAERPEMYRQNDCCNFT